MIVSQHRRICYSKKSQWGMTLILESSPLSWSLFSTDKFCCLKSASGTWSAFDLFFISLQQQQALGDAYSDLVGRRCAWPVHAQITPILAHGHTAISRRSVTWTWTCLMPESGHPLPATSHSLTLTLNIEWVTYSLVWNKMYRSFVICPLLPQRHLSPLWLLFITALSYLVSCCSGLQLA